MNDGRTAWSRILSTLAGIERDRAFQPPLLIMAHHPSDPTIAGQEAVVKAMLERSSTQDYQSAHSLPLTWQLRVDDRGQVIGLTFVELEIRLPEGTNLYKARLRLVTGTKHPGWSLEARGPMDRWKPGWKIFQDQNQERQCKPRTWEDLAFLTLPEEKVETVIAAFVVEADRMHRLIDQIRTGI